MAAPKSMPPKAVRISRAREAGRAAHSVDAHIRALDKAAPELTTEQAERIRRIVVESRAAQGLPAVVDDPVALDRVATLFRFAGEPGGDLDDAA